jgi:SRSO17 transposase
LNWSAKPRISSAVSTPFWRSTTRPWSNRGASRSAQYCGQLGKQANCQVLVSLTLARREVPVCVGLRPFLPETWARDPDRRLRAGVPLPVEFQPKWRIALEEIDRVRAAGAVFGCVAADAEYGKVAHFRAGLAERGLRHAVGIPSTQTVYPADVTLEPAPRSPTGRPAKHPVPSVEARTVAETITALPAHAWRFVSWRTGTKGRLRARFVALRVRVADGAPAGVCRARSRGWSVSSGPRTSADIT